ncbi:hypothetical protein BT96DRAFT_1003260 [Gymnopus androsaceus JB14]|uniref:Uncharacterized protein n=1 Tax=Gymnopus androsaceus JB14 TaxID=1447944 RepID=A0A6A4GVB3_9AGAR|nr:hypothetical protein BT96DRAFT_1003260 [Gymnopus androsaceus JB14]
MSNQPTMPYTTYEPIPVKPNVKGIKSGKANKLLKHNSSAVESICLLRFHDNTSTVYLNSLNSEPTTKPNPSNVPPELPPPEPIPANFRSFVPKKYLEYAKTVFNPTEFEKLPEH